MNSKSQNCSLNIKSLKSVTEVKLTSKGIGVKKGHKLYLKGYRSECRILYRDAIDFDAKIQQ